MITYTTEGVDREGLANLERYCGSFQGGWEFWGDHIRQVEATLANT